MVDRVEGCGGIRPTPDKERVLGPPYVRDNRRFPNSRLARVIDEMHWGEAVARFKQEIENLKGRIDPKRFQKPRP